MTTDLPFGKTRVTNTATIFSRETDPIEDTESFSVIAWPEGGATVGIDVLPVNKAGLLVPWLLLAGMIMLAAVGSGLLARRAARRSLK